MKLEAGKSMEGENSILAEAACIATHNHGNVVCQYTLNKQKITAFLLNKQEITAFLLIKQEITDFLLIKQEITDFLLIKQIPETIWQSGNKLNPVNNDT